MILWNERQWRREMLLCALVFQVIFLGELAGFWEMIVVDPQVHRISYENWGWFINDWQPPAYWEHNSLRILAVAQALNMAALALFWANALYVWFHRERFGHSRPAIARRSSWSRRRPCSSGGTSSIRWTSTACLCTPSTRSCSCSCSWSGC